MESRGQLESALNGAADETIVSRICMAICLTGVQLADASSILATMGESSFTCREFLSRGLLMATKALLLQSIYRKEVADVIISL